MSKYGKADLKSMAKKAIGYKSTDPERYQIFVMTLSIRTLLPIHSVENRIQEMANY